MKFKEPGKYKVTASIAAMTGDASAVVEVGDHTAELKPPATGSWDKFSEFEVGTIEVSQAGEQTVKVRPRQWPDLEGRSTCAGSSSVLSVP